MENFAYLCTNENNEKSMKKTAKKTPKTYLYYATEENCFECDKYETTDPIGDVKSIMEDDYLQTDEIHLAALTMRADFDKNGFAIYETIQGQGYGILIAIARHGKCTPIRKKIDELRREAIAMCY